MLFDRRIGSPDANVFFAARARVELCEFALTPLPFFLFLMLFVLAPSAQGQAPTVDPAVQQAGNQAVANAEKLRAAGKLDAWGASLAS